MIQESDKKNEEQIAKNNIRIQELEKEIQEHITHSPDLDKQIKGLHGNEQSTPCASSKIADLKDMIQIVNEVKAKNSELFAMKGIELDATIGNLQSEINKKRYILRSLEIDSHKPDTQLKHYNSTL